MEKSFWYYFSDYCSDFLIITNRDSNLLPHDLRYDFLSTTLKKGVVNENARNYTFMNEEWSCNLHALD